MNLFHQPISGDRAFSLGLPEHQAHIKCTDIHASKILKEKINQNIKDFIAILKHKPQYEKILSLEDFEFH